MFGALAVSDSRAGSDPRVVAGASEVSIRALCLGIIARTKGSKNLVIYQTSAEK